MGANSFIFFGLLLIPLIAFLIWMIKQDKKRNYLGLFFLVLGVVVAAYTIVKLDEKYMNPEKLEPKTEVIPKSSSFK